MRRFLIGGLIALAVLGSLGSGLGWWARRELVSAGGFAAQTQALQGRLELRASTQKALTAAMVGNRPELRAAAPEIRAAVDAAIAGPELPAVERRSFARLQRQLADAASPLTLDVGAALPLVAAALRTQGHPELAVLTPPASTEIRIPVADRAQHPLLWSALEWTAGLWWLLPILSALFLGGAIFASFRPLDTAALGAAAIGGGSALLALGAAVAPSRASGSGRIVAAQFAPSLVAQSVVVAFVATAAAGACVLVALRASRRQARTMTAIRIADVRRALEPDLTPALRAPSAPVALPAIPAPTALGAGPATAVASGQPDPALDTTTPPESGLGRVLADLMRPVVETPLLAQRPERPPARAPEDGDDGEDDSEVPPDPWTSTFLPTRGAADST
jgi:hypothetical protein